MQELDQALKHAMTGPARDAALLRCREQVAQWGVALPDVTPVVHDFGLGEFETTGLIEFWIANEVEAGYCGKFLFLFDGQTCPAHRHKVKRETFFVMKGRMRTEYDGAVYLLDPGDTLLIEPWKYHDIRGVGPMLLLEISMPGIVDDNYFLSTRVPMGRNFNRDAPL